MKVSNSQVNSISSFAKEFNALNPEARMAALTYVFERCPKLAVSLSIEAGINPREVINYGLSSVPIMRIHSRILSITRFGKDLNLEPHGTTAGLIEARKQQIDSFIKDFRKNNGVVPSKVYLNSDYEVRDENVSIRSIVETHNGVSEKSIKKFKQLAGNNLYFFPYAVIKNLYPDCLDKDGKTIKKEFRNKIPEELLKAYEKDELIPEQEVINYIEKLTGNKHSNIYRDGLNASNFDEFGEFSKKLLQEVKSAFSGMINERLVTTPDGKTQIKLVVEKGKVENISSEHERVIMEGSTIYYGANYSSIIVIDNKTGAVRELEEHERIKYNVNVPDKKVMPVHNSIGRKQKKVKLKKLIFLNSGMYYDLKKNKLYYTDGKELFLIYNPFKRNYGYDLLKESICVNKELVCPAEAGINIGRKTIKLPQNLPVSKILSAKKVGSTTVIIFESELKLVQLVLDNKTNINSKESIKITILNPSNDSVSFNQKSNIFSYNTNLKIKVNDDGTVTHVKNDCFARITCGVDNFINDTYQHIDSDKNTLIYYEDKIVDTNDPLVVNAIDKFNEMARNLDSFLIIIGSHLKHGYLHSQDISEVLQKLPVELKDEYPSPGALFFFETIRQKEIEKGNYTDMADPEDIERIVNYIHSRKHRKFDLLTLTKPNISELIPERRDSETIEPGHSLKSTYGMRISPRYSGIIVGSVLQYDKSSNLFIPIDAPSFNVENGKQITFSGEFDTTIQLKHPPNSKIVSVLVNGQAVEVKPNKSGVFILDLDKKSTVAYTVAIAENAATGENVACSSLNLPDDPKIYKIVEKANRISDLQSRIDFIKKEYAKISVYRVNKKTKQCDLKNRFSNMKKGKYYYGVCADHAVLGHAILSAAGLNAVILTGNSCSGKRVVISPKHACNGVKLVDGRIVEVDLTPARINLRSFFNFFNFLDKKNAGQNLKAVESKKTEPLASEVQVDKHIPLESNEQLESVPEIKVALNAEVDKIIEANNGMIKAAIACLMAELHSDNRKKLEEEFQDKSVIYHDVINNLKSKIPAIDFSDIEKILKGRVIKDTELDSYRQELNNYISSKH